MDDIAPRLWFPKHEVPSPSELLQVRFYGAPQGTDPTADLVIIYFRFGASTYRGFVVDAAKLIATGSQFFRHQLDDRENNPIIIDKVSPKTIQVITEGITTGIFQYERDQTLYELAEFAENYKCEQLRKIFREKMSHWKQEHTQYRMVRHLLRHNPHALWSVLSNGLIQPEIIAAALYREQKRAHLIPAPLQTDLAAYINSPVNDALGTDENQTGSEDQATTEQDQMQEPPNSLHIVIETPHC